MSDGGGDIARVVEAYKAAIFAKDAQAFLDLYLPDVRVFDLWGEWSYDGVEAWGQSVKGWFGSLGPERVVADVEVVRTLMSPGLAVVEAFVAYKAVSESGEILRAMRNRLSWALKETEGTWKIAHEHTSAPADPSTTKVMLDAADPR